MIINPHIYRPADPLIALNDLRTPRSYGELKVWVSQVSECVDSDDASKASFRLSSGAVKNYREEVLPVRDLAECLGVHEDESTIMFPADSGQGDAFLTDSRLGLTEQRIEIAHAVDGQDDRLRMELLSSSGHAPGLGPIQKVGPNKKAGYRINATSMAMSRRAIVMAQRELVRAVTEQKCAKRYPPGTWLLVCFVDAMIRGDDYAAVTSEARDAAHGCQFDRVYLLGSASDTFCALVWEAGKSLSVSP